MSFLRIENLHKNFGAFTALHSISLEIEEGEFVCFLGPSGCGKTTLLRAIAGLDIQTGGRIWQAGREISALPVTERDFGIVFQSYALFPNLTVEKNIAYGLANRGLNKKSIAKKVHELLQLVGMPEQGAKYPAQLSGGQQQRVALARAIATSPGLLLLDEPLSALDARVRAYLRFEVKQLQRELGVTTVMVTHDQEEALTMADRIIVMNAGAIEQVGAPDEIYRRPATRFVADFIGTMNFVDATSTAADAITVGDVQLACPCVEGDAGFPVGTAVTAAIRPEDIGVVTDTAAENTCCARIQGVEFLGSFIRAIAVSAELQGAAFTVDLSADLAHKSALAEGKEVVLQFPPRALHLFARES